MDDDNGPSLYEPMIQETLEAYIERYTVKEIKRIIESPEKRIKFCALLRTTLPPKCSKDKKEESEDKKVSEIIKNTKNYRILLYRTQMWVPRRQELLKKLSDCSNDLCIMFKCCTVGRIIGCFAEISCTIGGLYYLESVHADLVLNAAAVFGLLGFFCTMVDTLNTKQRISNLEEIVQIERKLFASIEEWFNQHEEIKNELGDMFALDFSKEMEKFIKNVIIGKKYFDPMILVGLILLDVYENDRAHDKNLIGSLVNFLSFQSMKEFFKWVIFLQTNRNLYDILKIALQHSQGDKRFFMFQKVRALKEDDQNLQSFPVLGRLFLNGLSIVSDAYLLRRHEVPRICELTMREEELSKELEVMKRIVLGDSDLDS